MQQAEPPPYNYTWSDALAQPTSIATNLCNGTYTVTVTDAMGCNTLAQGTVSSPSSLLIDIASDSSTCGYSNGSACVNISGGVAPYNYLWDDINAQTNACALNIFEGMYHVTVTDFNQCIIIDSIYVYNIVGPEVTANLIQNTSCFNSCDGIVTASITGGTAPFNYSWDDPLNQNTDTAIGLCANQYFVTVEDKNSCISIDTIIVSEPTEILISSTSVNSNCGQMDGEICINVSGGTPGYSYAWNDPNNQTTNCAYNISSGNYSVTVTDANNCEKSSSISIVDNAKATTQLNIIEEISCYNSCNGMVNAIITGGVPPYNILWSDPNNQTNDTAFNLCVGKYYITVTESNGCITIDSIELLQPDILQSSISYTNSTCSKNNGSACVIVNGGIAPYSYVWSDGLAQTNICANNILSGWYYVTITDQNNCILIDSTEVEDEPTPIINSNVVSNVSCYGECNGKAEVNISGGKSPFNILWNDPALQTNDTASNLCAGTYVVTVVDNNGCSTSDTVIINQPDQIILNVSSTNSNCNQSDGEACVTASGGTGMYTYLWDDLNNQTTNCAQNLTPGAYQVQVTDQSNCVSIGNINVLNNTSAVINAQVIHHVSCYNLCDASAWVEITGAAYPVSIVWNDPNIQTNDTATGLCAGNYEVTVTESNGCISTSTITVNEPTELQLNIITTDEICPNACDGNISISASGGVGNYVYSINNGLTFQSSNTFNGLCNQNYQVVVKDSHDCVYNQPVNIGSGNYVIEATILPEDSICELSSSINMNAINSGGIWAGNGIVNSLTGEFSPNIAGEGSHTIYYTTPGVCGETDSTVIIVKSNFNASIIPTDNICEGEDDIILQSINSGGIWTGNGIINPITGLFSPTMAGLGSHFVTYYYPYLCGDTQSTQIIILPRDSIHIFIDSMCVNTPPITLSTLATGYWNGNGIINPNPGIFNATSAGLGNHTIYYINPNSCLDTQSFPIYIHPLPIIDIQANDYQGCAPLEVEFENSASTSNSICVWNIEGINTNSCNSVNHTFSSPGLYNVSLSITDEFGCSNSKTEYQFIEVFQNSVANFDFIHHEQKQEFEFINLSENAEYFYWNFNSSEKNPTYDYSEEELNFTFCLEVYSKDGCIDSICRNTYINPPFYVYIPNTFTPNKNGTNDYYHPVFSTYDSISDYSFSIFTRWGDVVFSSENPIDKWDGYNNKTLCEQGVYSWRLLFIHKPSNTTYEKYGKVILLSGEE